MDDRQDRSDTNDALGGGNTRTGKRGGKHTNQNANPSELKIVKVRAWKTLNSSSELDRQLGAPCRRQDVLARFRVVVGHAARALTHSPRSLAEPHGKAMLVVPHLLSPAVRVPHLVRARPAAAFRTSVAAMVDEPEPQAGWRLPFDPFDWSALWGGDEADAEPKLVG